MVGLPAAEAIEVGTVATAMEAVVMGLVVVSRAAAPEMNKMAAGATRGVLATMWVEVKGPTGY